MKYTLKDIKAAESRFWPKVNKDGPIPEKCPELGPCWEWTGALKKKKGGYGSFRINTQFTMEANRCSLILATQKIYRRKEKEACHTCNNKRCVNPDHLYWGTPLQNIRDAIEDGVFVGHKNLPPPDDPRMDKSGENNGRHKLTEKQVAEIRQKYIPRKYGIVKLAQEYGVSKSMISYITRRENWK